MSQQIPSTPSPLAIQQQQPQVQQIQQQQPLPAPTYVNLPQQVYIPNAGPGPLLIQAPPPASQLDTNAQLAQAYPSPVSPTTGYSVTFLQQAQTPGGQVYASSPISIIPTQPPMPQGNTLPSTAMFTTTPNGQPGLVMLNQGQFVPQQQMIPQGYTLIQSAPPPTPVQPQASQQQPMEIPGQPAGGYTYVQPPQAPTIPNQHQTLEFMTQQTSVTPNLQKAVSAAAMVPQAFSEQFVEANSGRAASTTIPPQRASVTQMVSTPEPAVTQRTSPPRTSPTERKARKKRGAVEVIYRDTDEEIDEVSFPDSGPSNPSGRTAWSHDQIYESGESQRTSIPNLYQHNPRSPPSSNDPHQRVKFTKEVEGGSPREYSSAKYQKASKNRKRASTQPSLPHPPPAVHSLSDDESSQDKLTAFSSTAPLRKFPSGSTVSARHIEKDRLMCIHGLGVLEGMDSKASFEVFVSWVLINIVKNE
jgi:hypothetical protein